MEDARNPASAVFQQLEQLANDGDFEKDPTLLSIFKLVLDTKVRRKDLSGKLMKGIRYDQNQINLYVLLRGRGIHSTGPFKAMRSVIGGPSERNIR